MGAFDDLIPQQQTQAAQPAQASANPFADLVPSNNSNNNPGYFGIGMDALNRGLLDIGEQFKQPYLQATEAMGYQKPGTAASYQKQVDSDKAAYDSSPAGQSTFGKTIRFGADIVPYLIPGRLAAGLVQKAVGPTIDLAARYLPEAPEMLSGAAKAVSPYVAPVANAVSKVASKLPIGTLPGMAMGASLYVPEGGSRTTNALLGGLFGAGAPAAVNAGLGVGAKVYNAVKGNVVDPIANSAIMQGIKNNVPVFFSDLTHSPTAQLLSRYLESVPLIGSRGERQGQMQAAQTAANNQLTNLQNNMLAQQYGGPNGMQRLQQAAQSSGPRAQAAKGLLDNIKNSGDDWNDIVKLGGGVKTFLNKLQADKLYGNVANVADKLGPIDTSSIGKAINGMIGKLQKSVIPNKPLLSKLTEIRDNLFDVVPGKPASSVLDSSGNPLVAAEEPTFVPKQLKYSQLRDFRSDLGDEISDYFRGNNAVIGSKGVGNLMALKNQVSGALDNFAKNSTNPELKSLWEQADDFYKNQLTPLKDNQLAKALTTKDPDTIYNAFIKRGELTDRAQRFYNALDEKGQSAVRYGIVRNAINHATGGKDNEIFSPGAFASYLNQFEGPASVFFKGQAGSEINGFKNLMAHIPQASRALENPQTGAINLPAILTGGLGVLSGISPVTGAATAAATYGLKKLMTTNAGRRFLMASSKFKPNTPGMQRVYDGAMNFLKTAGAVGGVNNANNSQIDNLNQGENDGNP